MLLLKFADNAYAFAIWIASGIYKIAAAAFEVFIILSTGKVIDSNRYETIINNFYVVLGVVILFFLAFSLLKGMVNPDDQKQGTSAIKKIIINLVTSTIILAILPFIFGFLYDFQTSFITRYNVIGRFFGYGSLSGNNDNVDQSAAKMVEQGAYQITNGVFTAFLNVNTDYCNDGIRECQDKIINKTGVFRTNGSLKFSDTIDNVDATGNFNLYNEFSENITDGELDFQWLLSIIAGLILIYVAVGFCFDMAVRMVKLVFCQVIAPIPIFGRVVPDGPLKDSFNKWLKLVLTCYLEVYIRVFSFYFAIWLCLAMIDPDTGFLSNLDGLSPFIILLSKAFLIMGIIMFMKQVPKLISEATGLDSSNMKLGIGSKLKDGGFFTAGAAVGSAVTAGTRNLVNGVKSGNNFWKTAGSTIAGFGSGVVHGGRAGWKAGSFADMKNAAGKGAQAAVDARDKRAIYKSRHGGTIGGVISGHVEDTLYNVGMWAGLNNINDLLAQQKTIQQIQSERSAIDNESFDLIDGDLAKGKHAGGLSYDSVNAGHLGVTHDMDTLRAKRAALDAAKAGGNAADIAAAEVEYSKYRADWADEIRNISLLGETNWKNQDESLQAELSKVRMASDKYRETVSRNYNASYVSELSNASDILDREKDLTVNHSTLKQIKDKMKIKNTEITGQINRIRQKEKEKEGK